MNNYSLNKQIIFNKIKKNSINEIVQVVTESVDNFEISGEDKKKLSIMLITEFINVLPKNDYKIILLSCLESGIVNDMIDLVIDATKGKLNINKKSVTKILIKYLKCCLNILKKK